MTDQPDPSALRLETLRAVTRALAYPLEVVEVLRRVYGELARAIEAPICFFGAYDDVAQVVHVVWQIHNGQELPGGEFPLGNGATSQVLRTRQAQLIKDWSAQAPAVQVQYATDTPRLPESAIIVPVLFDERVLGVLSIQSYQPAAFDEDDLSLVQDIASQAAIALAWRSDRLLTTESPRHASELEALVASMPDGLLVLDEQGRLVRLNRVARALLCLDEASVILGHPVDVPQAGQWPLGTAALTETLRPMIELLKNGQSPSEQVEVALPDGNEHVAACRGSVLMRDGAPAGGVLVLREIARPRAA